MSVDIEIRNVGPHADLRLSFTPGVNVLRGRNAIGKSTAIQAAVTALGGKGTVSVRDGEATGQVSVGGVLALQIGRRMTKAGQPTVELGDHSAVGTIIEPGIIDPLKADAARVKAILSMVPVVVTAEVRSVLASGSAEVMAAPVPDGADGNILVVADHIRREANHLALEAERKAEQSRGAVDVRSGELEKQAPVDSAGLPAASEADAKVLELRNALARVAVLAEQRAKHEERNARIEATLGSRPEVSDADMEASFVEDAAAHRALSAAKKALADAEQRQAVALARRKLCVDAFEKSRDAAAAWDAQKAALDEPITGPVAADVDAGNAALNRAVDVASRARQAEYTKAIQDEIGALLSHMEESKRVAVKMREVAASVSGALGEILAQNGIAGLTVEDGRLYATVDGERRLFAERLSFGQKTRIALGIALRAFGGRVIPVDPAFWTGLQPSTQKEMNKLAVDAGVVLVTEEATDADEISIGRVE